MDFITQFSGAMAQAGIDPAESIVGDGKFRRYRVVGDPKGKKNGWYRLTVENEVAFGAFGCWKRDINKPWTSKKYKEMTDDERSRIKYRQDQRKKQEFYAKKRAALKAAELWAKAKPLVKHEYAARKGIKILGARGLWGKIIVPVRVGGEITSLQFIDAAGNKRFLTGGTQAGGYATVMKPGGSLDRFVICEGWATACSIYDATGITAIVAFHAGNLAAVAQSIRAKYHEAQIIIAGDDDKQTPGNPGRTKALEAARETKAAVAFPVFEEDASGSDFNDMFAASGPEAVRRAVSEARVYDKGEAEKPIETTHAKKKMNGSTPPENPVELTDEAAAIVRQDWRTHLIPGKAGAGFPYPYDGKSTENAYLFLKHHQKFAGLLIYNEFADQVMVARCPEWENPATFTPRRVIDSDFLHLKGMLERQEIKVSKGDAGDLAIMVAQENRINPPREFFERLKWDGVPRLDTWLAYYLGAEFQPLEYLAMVGARFLIGAVSRIYNPGAKFDYALILEGAQGIGKSSVLSLLTQFGGEEYFLDSIGDLRNKDTLMAMQGKMIVELSELASFKKANNEEIKGFISRRVDEYRPPYGRLVGARRRYFVVTGTTNEVDDGWMTDETGNRRYWPVRCGGQVDLQGLTDAREQLWAEAVERYKKGERTWINTEESKMFSVEQHKRFVEDAWQEQIREHLIGQWETDTDRLCKALELKPRDVNNMTKKRIKNCLRGLDWYETRREGFGRVWKPRDFAGKPTLDEALQDTLIE
jgi:putative DNA primase/helicase